MSSGQDKLVSQTDYILPDILTEITEQAVNKFYKRQAEMLNDIGNAKNMIFNFVTQYPSNIINETFIDSFGQPVKLSQKLPHHISNPCRFSYDMYPLNENQTMFNTPRPYSYLATFSISSFMRSKNDDIRWKAIYSLLEDQCQSRFTNIWRLLVSVLYAFDCINPQNNVFRYYVFKLIGGYGKLPFYERKGKFVFVNENISSIHPTLIYMIMSVCLETICDNINVGDAIFVIENYFDLGRGGYFDNKLKIKSAARNWIDEALHKLGTVPVINWGTNCSINGIIMRNTSECAGICSQFKKARDERQQKLSPGFYQYIDKRMDLIRTIDDVIKLLRICHAATNDRTYYKTLVELSLDKAVKPNIYETVVSGPIPIEKLTDGTITKFTYENQSEVLYTAQKFMTDVATHISSVIGSINPDVEWIKFLTTSSAGKKIDESELMQYTDVIRRLHNIRIVRAAIDVDKYRSHDMIKQSIVDKTSLVVRQQNDRRQRAIAGLTNPKLFSSFPSYLLGKLYYNFISDVAQGKQVGNILDVSLLLSATSNEYGLSSSVDISGMDTSIQPSVRRLFDHFTYTLARNISSTPFGPWYESRLSAIKYDRTTEKEEICTVTASGLFRALLAQTSNMQSSTTYVSKMFGSVISKEGTFESGRADTSTHHTVLLSSILQASRILYREGGNPDYGRYMRIMGDDMFIHYSGSSQDKLYTQAQFDSANLNAIGFKTTLDVSRNHAIFLQQQCILGRVFGLSCRVSLFTREHVKYVTSLSAGCSELRALRDDLLSRVKNPDNLSKLVNSVGLWCLTRHTISVSDDIRPYLVKTLSKKGIVVCEYTRSELLSILFPPMWLFMEGGGEMPCPAITYNNVNLYPGDSVYTPSGKWKRKLLVDIELVINSDFDLLKAGMSVAYHDLGISQSQLLIDLNLSDLERRARTSSEVKVEVDNLADTLDSLTPDDKRIKSKIAYHKLLARGTDIPKSLVYAYATHSKILQVVETGEIDFLNPKLFSSMLYAKLRELHLDNKRQYRIKFTDQDYWHLWSVVELDIKAENKYDANMTKLCPFVGSLEYDGVEHCLLQRLGVPSPSEGNLKRALSLVRGKFHNFKSSDPVFKYGLKLYRSSKDSLPLYFDSIGAGPRTRTTIFEALQYYSSFGSLHYDFITSPRQLFFLSDNLNNLNYKYLSSYGLPSEYSNVMEYQPVPEIHTKALMLTYAYIHLLSSRKSQVNKIKIILDERLIKRICVVQRKKEKT